MRSPDHQDFPRLGIVKEILRLAFLMTIRETSPGMLILSHVVPEVLRMTTYILIAYIAGGPHTASAAAAGAVALITVRMTVSEQSGVPVQDVWYKTMGANVTASLPLWMQYAIRSVPIQMIALLDSAIAFVLVAAVAPSVELSPAAWLMSLSCIPSGVAFGIALSVSCLGKNMHNMVHNIAASVLTVCTGAVIPSESIPVASKIGAVLPITNAAKILQSGQATGVSWRLVGCELLVGLLWAVVGVLVFRIAVRLSHRAGSTYLGT